MKYIATKKIKGTDYYLKEDGTFTPDKENAKEHDFRWWLELIKALLELILKFGIIKFIKK